MIYWVNMEPKNKFGLLAVCYLLLTTVFAVYSYAFLDVGLTLTSFQPYLRLQKKMQWFGYFNRPRSTIVFIVLSLLFFLFYYLLFKYFKQGKIPFKNIIWLSILICPILILSYPAFSHDIFNYIFNAKMVLVYGADPHQKVAMDFPDAMLGFMRNIHTPAPYFYGWTLISLLPYILGLGRIFPEIISFKIFSSLCLFLSLLILKKIYSIYKLKKDKSRLVLFLLNPFLLIEAIVVGHNDLTMMVLAFLAFYFLIKFKKEKKWKLFIFSAFFFLASVSNKYATIILLPLLIIWYFKPKFDLGFWGAILLFLLPFIRPLDQLHSWYFIWPLTWILLAKKMKHVYFAYFMSFFALLRYAPYVWYGNWDPPVPINRLLIYFMVPVLCFPVFILRRKTNNQ